MEPEQRYVDPYALPRCRVCGEPIAPSVEHLHCQVSQVAEKEWRAEVRNERGETLCGYYAPTAQEARSWMHGFHAGWKARG